MFFRDILQMLFLPLGCLLTSLMTPFDQQMFLILVWFGLLLFFLCWVLFMCDLRNLCLSQGPGGRLLCDFGGFVFYCSHLDRRSLWSWLAGGRARPVFCWLRTLRFQALADWLPPSHGAVAAPLSRVTCAGGRRSVSLAAVLPCFHRCGLLLSLGIGQQKSPSSVVLQGVFPVAGPCISKL